MSTETVETVETGPVDYLVVEFPGNQMKGEALARLVDLVDAGTIRILDLVFVRRDLDGSTTTVEIADLDGDGELDLAVFEGASSGLIDADDVGAAAAVIDPGSSAGSWSTRTPGPHRSPPLSAGPEGSWSPADGSRWRTSWPPSTTWRPPRRPCEPRSRRVTVGHPQTLRRRANQDAATLKESSWREP